MSQPIERSPLSPDAEPSPPAAEAAPTRAAACELCGGAVLDRHCKIVCLTCGFIRDCSDP